MTFANPSWTPLSTSACTQDFLTLPEDTGHFTLDPDSPFDFSVDPTEIQLEFTRDRVIDPNTLEPGTIAGDIGRHAQIASTAEGDTKLATAVIDHHHMPRGISAASLVFANKAKIAEAGEIRSIRTHADPDLDAIAFVMLVNAIRTTGNIPEPLKGFVDYVTALDSGALVLSNVSDLKHTLGMVCLGLSKIAKDKIWNDTLTDMGRAHLGEVFANQEQGKFFGTINQKTGPYQVALVSNFISQLFNNGYDVYAAAGLVLREHVPGDLVPLYEQAVDKMENDIDWFNQQREIDAQFTITLSSEVTGSDTSTITLEPSLNTVSELYPYLYATGVSGGLIFKDNIAQMPDGSQNRDYKEGAPLQGSKVVLAISDEAGVSLDGVEVFLNDLEKATRERMGLSATPEKETVFWKMGVPDRLIISTEGTVLTRAEVIEALEAYKP